MEFVDGEGIPSARAAIEAHLASCGACQALVADQQRLAGTMQDWRVAPAPASLHPPAQRTPRVWWRPSRSIAAGLAAAAVVLIAVAIQQRPRTPAVGRPMAIALGGREISASTPGGSVASRKSSVPMPDAAPTVSRQAVDSLAVVPEAANQAALRAPSVIRTARLQIVVKDFTTTRATVESIVTAANGFIDHLTVSGDTSRVRAVQGTLRMPSDRLTDVLTRLRALGQVVEDTQGSQDVTDQIVDLDARLASARATEQRLTDLLRNRTGRLSDVLEVERELTRVRLDIERLDAEKTNMTRRVTYATVDVTISEERKETIAGPLSLTTRLKVAALDGIESAFDSVAGVVLFALRAGPSLVFWGTLAGLTWLLFRRRFRDSPKPMVSE